MLITHTDAPVASNVVAFAVIGEPWTRSRINSVVAESAANGPPAYPKAGLLAPNMDEESVQGVTAGSRRHFCALYPSVPP